MGCVSSKLLRKTIKQEILFEKNVDLPNHVVSLTSSTYGALKLDQNQHQKQTHVVVSPQQQQQLSKKGENNEQKLEQKNEEMGTKVEVFVSKKSQSQSKEELEVINTWELMEGLEEEIPMSNQVKKTPKSTSKGGKENKGGQSKQQCYSTPRGGGLKSWKFSSNSTNKLRKAGSLESPRKSISGVSTTRRRSLGPLFDPELIESLQKELVLENEQIKEMVSSKQCKYSSRKSTKMSSILLESYKEKCPPGGEDSVVFYSTTLRGIRKTFEDCNAVRSVVESYNVRVIERDVSMDSGFKEELRKLMGTKEVKVPLVFVKGRLIGGADEVVKLDEEGKLQGLFEGIPKALVGCEGCGGIRFIMCMDCNGSCKVLDGTMKKMVRCGECNENGLIQCPICC